MDKTITVWVGLNIIYLYGTVNGETATFTIAGDGNWDASVPRSGDDSYVVHLEAYSSGGLEGTYDYTIYYGWIPVITDRTQADVDKAKTYKNKVWSALSNDEKTEWLSGLKGAYNASDLNRVGQNINYITSQLHEYGYLAEIAPKIDWKIADIPSEAKMAKYLSDVSLAKEAFHGTIIIPATMNGLNYDGANNIEKLLEEVSTNISNMIAEFYYSGELYSGEV